MANLNNNARAFTIRDFLGIIAFLIVFVIGAFVWIFYGTPIHDFNLWVLERSFVYADIKHPSGSILLEKKTYLGGKYTHGNSNCVYAVGEMRETKLTKEEIRNVYKRPSANSFIGRLPLYLIFEDEMDGPYEMPFVIWQDEIWEVPESTNTFYIVHTFRTFPLLFDLRCDDVGPYSYIVPL